MTKGKIGFASAFAVQITKLATQFLVFLLTSRFVDRGNLGLFAVAIAYISLMEVIRESGFRIMASQLERNDKQINELQISIVRRGVFVTFASFIVCIFSIFIFEYYAFAQILFVLSLTLFFNSLTALTNIALTNREKFLFVSLTELVSVLAGSTVAISLALLGGEVWALVFGYLTQSLTLLLMRFASLKSHFNIQDIFGRKKRFRDSRIMDYGKIQLLNWISINGDTVIVFLTLGSVNTGTYGRAFGLVLLPQIILLDSIERWVLPLIKNRMDIAYQDHIYISKLQALIFPIFLSPAIVFLLYSEDLVIFFLGQNWLDLSNLIQFFAIAGAFNLICLISKWLLILRNSSAILFRTTLASKSLTLVSLLIGSNFGIQGVSFSYLIGTLISAILFIVVICFQYGRIYLYLISFQILAISPVFIIAIWLIYNEMNFMSFISYEIAKPWLFCASLVIHVLMILKLMRAESRVVLGKANDTN